jgi:hypothetical protein
MLRTTYLAQKHRYFWPEYIVLKMCKRNTSHRLSTVIIIEFQEQTVGQYVVMEIYYQKYFFKQNIAWKGKVKSASKILEAQALASVQSMGSHYLGAETVSPPNSWYHTMAI